MGSFPPRECGIATFTKDLVTAMDNQFSPTIKYKILAMNKNSVNFYNYSEDVIYQIDDTNIKEYIDAAKKINENESIKLVNIQHEFGLFGGTYGDYIIPFMAILKKPIVITFHSVLPKPDEKLRVVVRAIADRVDCIVVMNSKAIDILQKDYLITKDIAVIPHGIPTVAFNSAYEQKVKLGYKDKILLSSFGLMSAGKGYEYIIEALPEVVKLFPNLLYIIMGQTHPTVRKNDGEEYRNMLEEMVKKLNLKNHVKFYNKYLDLKEIIKYLKATDVYICPNKDPNQITSGTLSYAMGCGRAVISTPFLHAIDVINEERGMLVEFNNPKSFSDAIIKMLSDSELKSRMENNAYTYTRGMVWPNISLMYMNLFNSYINAPVRYVERLPSIKFSHLHNLTDQFGIIQFARHTEPDIHSGYTLDDNARAMIVNCMHYDLYKEDYKLRRIRTYMKFIKHVQQSDGSLYNYVCHDKSIDLSELTFDAQGRALWALGYLISIKSIPLSIRNDAREVFDKALPIINRTDKPRPLAFALIGLYHYNKQNPSEQNVSTIRTFADQLVKMYYECTSKEWCWFENKLTYSNSSIPESLFYAYLTTRDKRYLCVARSALDFLSSITFQDDCFAPIGQKGWYIKDGERALFDQQPIDTGSMVSTLLLASKVTRRKSYLDNALIAFQWFLGRNNLNQVVYDESTGGCRDGVGEFSVNTNQGAESTLSYLMARLSLEQISSKL